ERASGPLLALAIALLGLVLIPGLGHAVNGSRRWLRLADINFQVSELSRMLVLVYLASYAVRREAELRQSFTGLGKPLVLLAGAALPLALFLGLIWRSFHIARLASDAHLRFQSLLAAGFGLWVGIQAFINIGVNMGVLPTKGLTLPLMSYGRSSLVVALAW